MVFWAQEAEALQVRDFMKFLVAGRFSMVCMAVAATYFYVAGGSNPTFFSVLQAPTNAPIIQSSSVAAGFSNPAMRSLSQDNTALIATSRSNVRNVGGMADADDPGARLEEEERAIRNFGAYRDAEQPLEGADSAAGSDVRNIGGPRDAEDPYQAVITGSGTVVNIGDPADAESLMVTQPGFISEVRNIGRPLDTSVP